MNVHPLIGDTFMFIWCFCYKVKWHWNYNCDQSDGGNRII